MIERILKRNEFNIRYQNKQCVQWMVHQKLIKSGVDKKHDWKRRRKWTTRKQMLCTVHGTTDPPSYLITRYISMCVQRLLSYFLLGFQNISNRLHTECQEDLTNTNRFRWFQSIHWTSFSDFQRRQPSSS